MDVLISSSPKTNKRLKAEFKTKAVHLGQAGGNTCIDHQNGQYKKAWIARHKVRGSFSNLQTASALAKGVLSRELHRHIHSQTRHMHSITLTCRGPQWS